LGQQLPESHVPPRQPHSCDAPLSQPLWAELAGPFKQAVDSFRLVDTTRDYIPPDQNPW
jgi:hypothetical protein